MNNKEVILEFAERLRDIEDSGLSFDEWKFIQGVIDELIEVSKDAFDYKLKDELEEILEIYKDDG